MLPSVAHILYDLHQALEVVLDVGGVLRHASDDGRDLLGHADGVFGRALSGMTIPDMAARAASSMPSLGYTTYSFPRSQISFSRTGFCR